MSRTLTSATRAALYAPQTGKVLLHLLTIDHADMAAPVRLVDDLVDIVSRGDTYTAFPFEAALPVDTDGEVPQLEITCDAVTRELIVEIRSIATPATMTLEVVAADSPDDVEAGPYVFDVVSAQYDATEITLRLTYEPLTVEPFPALIFNPHDFPLLFQAVDE